MPAPRVTTSKHYEVLLYTKRDVQKVNDLLGYSAAQPVESKWLDTTRGPELVADDVKGISYSAVNRDQRGRVTVTLLEADGGEVAIRLTKSGAQTLARFLLDEAGLSPRGQW